MVAVLNSGLGDWISITFSFAHQVAELEKCQQAENQSELEALLDQTRQDKARGEQRLASLQESLALSQNEASRLRESLATKEEELKVGRMSLLILVLSL